MKKNILNLYEGFFDDLDKLNPNQNKEDKVNNKSLIKVLFYSFETDFTDVFKKKIKEIRL